MSFLSAIIPIGYHTYQQSCPLPISHHAIIHQNSKILKLLFKLFSIIRDFYINTSKASAISIIFNDILWKITYLFKHSNIMILWPITHAQCVSKQLRSKSIKHLTSSSYQRNTETKTVAESQMLSRGIIRTSKWTVNIHQ